MGGTVVRTVKRKGAEECRGCAVGKDRKMDGQKIPAASFALQSLFRFVAKTLFGFRSVDDFETHIDLLLDDQNLDGITVRNTHHFAGEVVGGGCAGRQRGESCNRKQDGERHGLHGRQCSPFAGVVMLHPTMPIVKWLAARRIPIYARRNGTNRAMARKHEKTRWFSGFPYGGARGMELS